METSRQSLEKRFEIAWNDSIFQNSNLIGNFVRESLKQLGSKQAQRC